MGHNPKVPDESREWKVGEPLRHSLESIPLQPSAQTPQALSELKPQIEVELGTLALLARGRHLSERERRQESALRNLLALIEQT